ncbi:MAG: hypothetical protein EKK53_07550 [Burkholderiales bacterium]|nr:MAG: hypothetical protein EKK53_07550 [Burkholderiales bacterium]
MATQPTTTRHVPCCPPLIEDDNCDVLDFSRTLAYPLIARDTRVVAQLTIGFRFKRCTLGLTLGDPVYSTTLFPGETVRLVTTDRRSSFVYDASTKLAYRSEQMSEEQYFMTATQAYFAQSEAQQSGDVTSTDKGHWDFKGSADAGVNLLDLGGDANASASGNHDSSSTLDYLHRQSSTMREAASQALQATRAAHSVSVGEVATRTHVEGESEDHFEASSREFTNKNACHAVTYYFYRLNKKVEVSFEITRLTIGLQAPADRDIRPPMTPERRAAVLKEITQQLVAAGVLDGNGRELAPELRQQLEFSFTSHLPTAGTMVKGCLDECNVCEPARRERVHLENELLRKQIELLEKSQEYRCCPAPAVADCADS